MKAVINFVVLEQGLECQNAFAKVYLPSAENLEKRHAITPANMAKIKQECLALDDDIRWLVAIIFDTGIRLSGAAGLMTQDIHLDTEVQYISLIPHPHRRLKTASSERNIPLAGSSLLSAKRLKQHALGLYCFPRYSSEVRCNSNSASATLNKMSVKQLFIGALTMLLSLTYQVNAAELSLVCPCQAERVGQTAVKITTGVINKGETKSNELRIVLGSSASLPSSAYTQAVTYPPQTLKPGEIYRVGTETTVAFNLPPKPALDGSGRTNLILRLQEKVDDEWATRDTVRIGSPQNFPDPKTGGESAKSRLFLEGKPSL